MSPDEKRMQNTKISLMVIFGILFFFFAILVLNDLDKIVSNTSNYGQTQTVHIQP